MIELFIETLDSEFCPAADSTDKELLSNSPSHEGFRAYQLMGRKQPLYLFKVCLSLDPHKLCHEYEIMPCIGKSKRLFSIPGHIIAKHGKIMGLPIDYQMHQDTWNEYPKTDHIVYAMDRQLDFEILKPETLDVAQVLQAIDRLGCKVSVNPVSSGTSSSLTLFCFSSLVSDHDKEISRRYSDRTLEPAAIVLTEYEQLWEYLYDMRTIEIREQLASFMSPTEAERLPILLAGDPFLPAKIRVLVDPPREDVEDRAVHDH